MAGCIGVTRDGSLCQGIAASGSDWCPAHDPRRAEARKRSASKAARSKKPTREIADVKEQVAELIRDVRAGNVDRADAIACGQLYNVLLRAVSVELKVRETEELERRLEEVEQLMAARKAEGPYGGA